MLPSSIANRIEIIVRDITTLTVDAVVTAANEAMCGGGGVDGAIHRAAGPMLMGECLAIGHCPQGEARITKGYQLHAKYIIHTVGPVWDGGDYGEPEILASCYRSSLKLASGRGVQSIAFPCIATGVYGFPKDSAAEIAVRTTAEWLKSNLLPNEVVFCCFDDTNAEHYRESLSELEEFLATD